jgi:hypothetical protein
MKGVFAIFAAVFAATSAFAQDADVPRCKLCKEAERQRADVPLRVEIDSGLSFSRLALAGRADGSASIDPETGRKWTEAGMIDLGGFAVSGRVIITGEPLRYLRIGMPSNITLRSPHGAEAEISDFRTSLDAMPRLDENGLLEFNFGGRLSTSGARGGNFRGRIPIHVEYD